MSPIARGFFGKRRDAESATGCRPGSTSCASFPVLTAGPTPRTPLDQWTFAHRAARSSRRAAGPGRSSGRCPRETITVDIHCVTKWSKFDTTWEGVSVDTLLDGVETDGAATSSRSATAATRPTSRSRT